MGRKNNLFTQVPIQRQRTNLFDLSHEVKMSGKFAHLMPVMLQETLPGDHFRNTSQVFLRFAPMLAPVMHRVDVTVHFFFVPNRLLWDEWEEFITGGREGEPPESQPVPPYFVMSELAAEEDATRMGKGGTWDYFGLPTWDGVDAVTSTERVSALPFRAYNKIWNDYYKDPNLDEEIYLNTPSGGNVTIASTTGEGYLFNPFTKAWEKDYFTSALPWAQRGEQVLVPFSAQVEYMPVSMLYDSASGTEVAQTRVLGHNLAGSSGDLHRAPAADMSGFQTTRIENIEDITNGTTTVADLRTAIAVQRWMEISAVSGHRYNETILGQFGVRVPDYRLQRAEYLGGGKQPVQFSEVVTTVAFDNGTDEVPGADLLGHGISVGSTNQFSYYCQEHAFVIGILSVTPRTAYQEGIHKLWGRGSRFDFAFPTLAHIGEQEIKTKELFYAFSGTDVTYNDATFGYIPRYSEYKFALDRVAGDFRDTLAFWHLGRIFTQRPVLNGAFTTCEPLAGENEEPLERIFAVQDGTDYLWISVMHNMHVRRPLPYFGVPRIFG